MAFLRAYNFFINVGIKFYVVLYLFKYKTLFKKIQNIYLTYSVFKYFRSIFEFSG